MADEITLKGNPVKLYGNLPQVGNTVDNYSFVDQTLKVHSLSDFKGKKVISIFPSLDTEVCLLSTKKLNEEAKSRENTSFLMISCDLPFVFKRVCSLEGLKNVTPLSLVQSKRFIKDLGLLMTTGPLKGLAARAVLILNEQNKIEYVEVVKDITEEPNYADLMKALN